MSMTETVGDVDIQVLEQTFEDDREPCSIMGGIALTIQGQIIGVLPSGVRCTERATWFLLCPEDRSAETMCDKHRAETLAWPDGEVITFDETCGHTVQVSDCIWEPYV